LSFGAFLTPNLEFVYFDVIRLPRLSKVFELVGNEGLGLVAGKDS